MKIYTRTGDDGTTSLFGGTRVSKDSIRVEAYGTIDELNSAIGLVRAWKPRPPMDELFARIQGDLFVLGSELASGDDAEAKLSMALIDSSDVVRLEKAIDDNEASLPQLRTFILPGGTHISAMIQLARTIARRAERRLVTLASRENVRPVLIEYVNRLSDLLFVLSRRANHDAGVPDVPWEPREPR